MTAFMVLKLWLIVTLMTSTASEIREEVKKTFEILVRAIGKYKCASDIEQNLKADYPIKIPITLCDLDLDIGVGYSNSSSVEGQNEVIFHSHPSARGLCNQIEYNSGFFQWSKGHNKAVLPPIFHMDGYNTTNDYLLPLSFIYDRQSFYEYASKKGLRIVQASDSVSRRRGIAIKSLGRNCFSLEARCLGLAPSQLNEDVIIRADHWKRLSRNWITFPLSKHITTAVDPIVNYFRSNGNFLAFHFRVEIATSNREAWAKNADFGGLEDTLRNVSTILQQYMSQGGKSKNVYVASYLPQDHTSFKALRNAVQGFNIFTKFDFFPRDIEIEPLMTRNMMALIEFSVLERAEVFIGNCRSSFSRTIALRRNPGSHPNVWTYPCEK